MLRPELQAIEYYRYLSITHHDRRYEPGVAVWEGVEVSRLELELLAARGLPAAVAALHAEALRIDGGEVSGASP